MFFDFSLLLFRFGLQLYLMLPFRFQFLPGLMDDVPLFPNR